MKNIYKKGLMIALSIISFSACTNELETVDETVEEQTHSIRMNINVTKTDFDATRATSDSWKDGDVIYLRFHTNNGVVTGNATYSASRQDWELVYNGSLTKDADNTVEVTYFDSSSSGIEYENNKVTLYEYATTGIYQDTLGTYLYKSDYAIKINANLMPITSRIRFKNDYDPNNYEPFYIDGVYCYYSYNLKEGTFETTKEVSYWKGFLDSGYTNYIYVNLQKGNTEVRLLAGNSVDNAEYLYTSNFSDDMLIVGKSGWMCFPTKNDHNGWTYTQVYGEIDERGWVDLGLSSGTKWATENIGANISEWQENGDATSIYGNYYSWGEIATKKSYAVAYSDTWGKSIEWLQSNYYINTNYELTSTYDAATANWGRYWKMPTKENFEELLNECTWTWTSLYFYDIVGYEVIGKNGKSIFLPAAGRMSTSTVNDAGVKGQYWTSTVVEGSEGHSYSVEFTQTAIDGCEKHSRAYGYSIRPIVKN